MTSNNVWKTISLILLGVIIGYIIGRFELTTLKFDNVPEDTEKSQPTEQEKNDTGTDSDSDKTTNTEEDTEIKPIEVSIDDDPFLGEEDAKVTIVEFSDYQCPFCKKFFTDIFPSLKEDFIDTGKVKYVFRDLPLNIHPPAYNAALASECAEDQGKYWEMHDHLFDNQSDWGKAEDVNETLIGYASELGLKEAEFTDCLTSEKYKDEIDKDKEDATSYGARGTPTLFVNGKIVRGVPRSYDTFKEFIEEELGT